MNSGPTGKTANAIEMSFKSCVSSSRRGIDCFAKRNIGFGQVSGPSIRSSFLGQWPRKPSHLAIYRLGIFFYRDSNEICMVSDKKNPY